MTKTKTTILIDDDLLEQFRGLATSKHGGPPMLNAEFEEALQAYCPLEVIRSLAVRLNLRVRQYPSLDEVTRYRPRVPGSAGRILRRILDERAQRLLGRQ